MNSIRAETELAAAHRPQERLRAQLPRLEPWRGLDADLAEVCITYEVAKAPTNTPVIFGGPEN